ncbi:MAG: transposase [Pseudomonadota bacterium]
MSRRTLTDAQLTQIEHLVSGEKGDRSWTAADNWLFIDAILWLARAAAARRDPPLEFGNWRATHRRFLRCTRAGVWERFFNALAVEPDFEYVLINATISKGHADASPQE